MPSSTLSTIEFDIIYVCDNEDSNINKLKSIFKNVYIQHSLKDTILTILSRKDQTIPFVILIDIDSHYLLFEKICQSLAYNKKLNIISIACSKNDSTPFMLKCIEMGAFDYMIKPFNKSLLKTLFLNIYKSQSIIYNQSNQSNQSILFKLQNKLEHTYSIANNHSYLSNTFIKQYTKHKNQIINISLLNQITSEKERFLKESIQCWNFQALDLTEQELIQSAYLIFNQCFLRFPELKPFELSKDSMYHFILDIYNSYHDSNPYHNFKHAVDVLQSIWFYLISIRFLNEMNSRIKGLFRPIHILALLMAGLGHDVGHPGVNNNFMVATSTPLAVLYNDKSVLECYHSVTFFDLLKKHYLKSNIDIQKHSDYSDFRKVIIESILCTDMGCHQDYVQKLKSQIERLRVDGLETDNQKLQETERIIMCNTLMKCADISNCARPFMTAKGWAIVLSEEFYLQGDLEKELGLNSIPINERGKVSLADFQLGFINNVALELFTIATDLFPQLGFCLDHIKQNINIWKSPQ